MLYITSQSTGDGRLTINVVFKPGTNIDQAQVLVQNRVAVAEPRLPEDVRRLGIVGAQGLARPDDGRAHDLAGRQPRPAIHLQLRDALREGRAGAASTASATCNVFGARDYSMRVWLDPAQGRGARPDGRRGRRWRCAPPTCRSRPAPSTSRRRRRPAPSSCRCRRWAASARPSSSRTSCVRAEPDGSVTRVRDIARVELGAQDYTVNAYLEQQDRHRARHLPAAGLERAGDRRRRSRRRWSG